MNKKYAFILTVLLTGLIASNVFIFNYLSHMNIKETAVVSRVIDGDTLQLDDGRIIRLLNINTPEKGFFGAELAKNYLSNYENKSIELEITGTDKYLRNLGRIYSQKYLNLDIVEKGLASKFLVQDSELSDFAKVEEKAIKEGIGIWKHSEFFNCFNSVIDEKKEIVEIINICPKINVEGWILKDESRKSYKFKDTNLGKIRLHSEKGRDNATDVFWGNTQNIWNDDQDSLYLFDKKGGIVNYETYGY